MRKILALAVLAAAFAGCSGGDGSSTSGSTGGSSGASTSTSGSSGGSTTGCSSTAVCHTLGDVCATQSDCCAQLTCTGGFCQPAEAAPSCKADGEACTSSDDCCGSASAGTKLACVPGPGGSVCHLGTLGEACDTAMPCAPFLVCVPPASTNSSSSSSGSGSTSSGSGSGTTSSGSDSGSTSSGSDSGSTSSGSGSDSGSSGGGINAVPATPGVCSFPNERPGGPVQCIGNGPVDQHTTPCYAGDPCNPNADYCHSAGNSLVCDPTEHICAPVAAQTFSTCNSNEDCQAGAGENGLVCGGSNGFGNLCVPPCSTDADCEFSVAIDQANSNPPQISMVCEGTGATRGCVPVLCYDPYASDPSTDPLAGSGISGDPSVFYKPCAGHPDSRCEPQYWGDVSDVFGFCQAVRPGTGATVGQACATGASGAEPDLLCGTDATCLGGVCQALCDAAPATSDDTSVPHCAAGGGTCISAQGLNLVSTYQVGGCGTPCDPWTTDEAASGCNTFCGGPKAKCEWIIGDPVTGQPRGYCDAAMAQPLAIGGDCTNAPSACPQGTYCLSDQSGRGQCTQLCDSQAEAGTPDACPTGQSCTGFQGFQHAGYCQ